MSCILGRGTRAMLVAGASLALLAGGCTGPPPGGRTSHTTTAPAGEDGAASPAPTDQGAPVEETADTPSSESGVSIRVADRAQFDELLQQRRGKVVLVDFWATWCVPCVQQFPHTVEMHRKYAGRGLAVVSVSLDELSDQKKVLAFLRKQGAEFDNLLGHEGNSGETFDAFEVDGVPQIRLYDRSGRLRRTFGVDPAADKQFTPDDVEKAVVDLLGAS